MKEKNEFIVSIRCTAIRICVTHTYEGQCANSICSLSNNVFFNFFFYGKYESGHSASEQKIEEAVVNDVMSVRAVLEARTLPASGHRVACDKRQSYKTSESGVFFNQQLSRTVQPIR